MRKFKIILVLLIITGSIFGGYVFNDYLNTPIVRQEPEWETFTPGEEPENITAETVIRGVTAENRIISTSVSLSCEIRIEESFFDLNIMRRSQVLRFHGTALYTISLENLSERDVHIGEHYIRVYIGRPELYALNLDAEKTIIDRVERGILSFGAITMTPEDYKRMQVLALEQMREQISGEDIRRISEENAKRAAGDFFRALLDILSDEYMAVEIAFS